MTCELTEVVMLVFAWMMNQRWILGLESSRAIVRGPCPSRKLYPVGFALGKRVLLWTKLTQTKIFGWNRR